MADHAPLTAVAFPGSELLKPYVPRLAIEWLRNEPELRHRQLEGSLAFVDISGFTNLTERLSKKGKVGAEEMNDLLDSTFTELLSVAYDFGARVIKWGGDAVLLLFSDTDHTAHACRAAAEMQRAMRAVGRLRTSSGVVTLRMSIGIHSGLFDFFSVGTLHRELIVTGPAATVTVATETTAEAGEIAVSAAAAAALDGDCLGEQRGEAYLLRRGPSLVPDRTAPVGDVGDVDLGRCMPVEIGNYLLEGGGEAEHRPLTTAFVNFGGTDDLLAAEGPEALADALEHCLDLVEGIALEYKVSFFDTDIAANGGKILLIAGAPSSAGNDEERMLRAMRAVLDGGARLPLRIGVNQGRIFVANFGPPYRRTYSVKGDAVNLAARVMAKAEPGQLLATDVVLARSRTSFETQALPPFHAKGKSEPVLAHAIGRPVQFVGRGEETPLIGRRRELALLLDGIAGARASEGALIEIVAEPGMGKSTLLAAAQREAPDVRTLTVQCDEYEASNPYFPLQDFVRNLLDLAPTDGSRQLERALSRRAPHLRPWLPLVATVVGTESADTPETAALDEQFRKRQLELTVVELLGTLLLEPTLLIFEDVHWLDEATADVLLAIAAQLEMRPWLVVLTRRDGGRGFAADGAQTISLEALGEEEAAELLAEATADHPLPPHQLEELAKRAGGNPLFLTELLAAARSPEGLTELPDSVEALLMAQIDRLAPDDRRVLRCAAVVGASFTPELLEAADGVQFDTAVRRRLADFVLDESGGRLRFRHALVRDAAYEGLPYRRRRDLHARVGEAIEAAAVDPDAESELLSLHFFNAGQMDKAWRYSHIAGNRAKDIFANVEAAAFLERALESSRRLPIPADEVVAVREALGDVRVRLGEFTSAGKAFREARRRASGDPVERARLTYKEHLIEWRLGRYPIALRWLSLGLRELDGVPGPEAGGERARLYAARAVVRGKQGRPRDSIALCRQAIEEAELSGARDALAKAYYTLDMQYSAIGRLESVENSERALAIYEDLGDLERQAIVLNSLGVYAHMQGRWDDSVDRYERARQAWDRAGDHWAASFATTNRGEVLSDQGHLDDAESLLRSALRIAKASDASTYIASISMYLGHLLARKGEFEEAHRMLEDSHDRFARAGAKGELLACDARTAECLVLEARTEEALRLGEETLATAATVEGSSELNPALERVRGCALMQLGRLEAAREALEKGLAAARELGMDYEIALCLGSLVTLEQRERRLTDDLELERDAIFQRLGVISVPAIPVH